MYSILSDDQTLPGLSPEGCYCDGDGVALFATRMAAQRAADSFAACPSDTAWRVVRTPASALDSAAAILRRCPRLVAHLICESLGYATPLAAAGIISAAHARKEHWCEWIASCYRCNPLPALQAAIRNRRYHKGYMADFRQARHLVAQAQDGAHPLFASWF